MSTKLEKHDLTFDRLISSVQNVDQTLQAQAGRAVNLSLTLRNWLIGCYIAEYELNGADKAVYGNNLLSNLVERLKELCVSNCNHRQIYDYLKFYRTYSRILPTLSAKLQLLLPEGVVDNSEAEKTVSIESVVPSEQLLNSLSYSKLKLLVNLDDETQRAFYEFECIRSNTKLI